MRLGPGAQLAQSPGELGVLGPRRSSAISSRRRCASAGEAPPVETAIAIGSWRWTAGRMNEHSSGTSTTLQRSDRASASRKTRRLTSVVDGRGDDEEPSGEILGAVLAASDGELELGELGHDLGSDDGDARTRGQQALDLLERDRPAADDEHAAARQVEARHVVARRRHRQTSTEVSRAPWRSSRSDRRPSSVASDSVYEPGPTAVSVAPSRRWPVQRRRGRRSPRRALSCSAWPRGSLR